MDNIATIIQVIIGLMTIGGSVIWAVWWVVRAFNKTELNFARVDGRLDSMDTRFDGVDKRLDGVDKRFDGIDKPL